ncbi:MAG: 3-oxoacyl-[acyl-carrier-protein] reductase [Lachnospiraceae bacterium]|nr:3-oxoacyl-[acyl-carrier-protein] reductase [Lachnospiraceae bacterium]
MMSEKIALVTGASGGIGRAIAVALAGAGAYVYVNYNGSQGKAEETVRLIEEKGGQAEICKFNVGDFEETNKAVSDIIAAKGRLDILVNNAGITKDGLMMMMTEAQFDDVININLKGAFNTIKAATRTMVKQRSGRIINITSVSGVMGNAGQANYSASKAGMIGLTKSMARELASRNITVNAVAPGFIETEMTAVLSDTVKEAAVKQIPVGRFGQPEDIANMVKYLASDEAAYVTGQVICVDGGMAM